MGAKYSSQATSGYNSSAPADDGTQAASNLITWAGIKTKLADVLKTFGEAINTALVAAFAYDVRQITTSDSVVAGDHMRIVEIAPTATTGVTVTLADAATMTSNFRVWIKNSSPHQQTIARATGGDTIEGTAANITIPAKASYMLQTTTGANGYLIADVYPLEITNLTEESATAVSDSVAIYDLSATALRKVQLRNLFASIGQIAFPATQNASSDANTLDDYEEGTWTPALTFATPGDLTVAYSTQAGRYTKIGRQVTVWGSIITSTFTHTTASGNLQITGLPFTAASGIDYTGTLQWQGITKASYTEVKPQAGAGAALLTFLASGSAQSRDSVTAANMPSGGAVILIFAITYNV